MSLHELLASRNGLITPKEALKISSKIVSILELIHSTGYTHNDIKPSNIMLDHTQNPLIIDFGFSKKYFDSRTMQHVHLTDVEVFQGNIIYSSLNQMMFKSTSRKDDLISLFYMTIMLLNYNIFPFVDVEILKDFKNTEEMQA